jgi:hypothetical protein
LGVVEARESDKVADSGLWGCKEAATDIRATLTLLSLVAASCSIPVGQAGDLRLVPSVQRDELANTGFSAGGSIMGVSLGFSVGSRCLGLVSGVDGDARCLGVGVQKNKETVRKEPTFPEAPVSVAGGAEGREELAAAPRIDQRQKERGVSAGASLFGYGFGASMSGRCVGATTELDGEGRCLGVGVRPSDDAEAATDDSPARTARSAAKSEPAPAPAPAR